MNAVAVTKRCSRCKTDKPISDFGVNRAKAGGRALYCRPCARTLTRESYRRNREAQLDYMRSRTFGISREQYDELLALQHGVCAICKQPETAKSRSGGSKSLGVDHDHETGRIRGLLCYRCNVALGYLKDDEGLLLAAAAYLRGVS